MLTPDSLKTALERRPAPFDTRCILDDGTSFYHYGSDVIARPTAGLVHLVTTDPDTNRSLGTVLGNYVARDLAISILNITG